MVLAKNHSSLYVGGGGGGGAVLPVNINISFNITKRKFSKSPWLEDYSIGYLQII